jgi:hypothetical protein
MSEPIVYIDTSVIRSGKFGELDVAMKRLASFVERNVPELISYAFYIDEDKTRMTVVAVHPDSASLEHHMDVGRDEFRKFGALIELQRIDVYGQVSDVVLARLHEKAKLLGTATVAVHHFFAGFTRRP